MANSSSITWEHRQAELWDRIFQVTQDVVALADSMETSDSRSVIQQEMVKSAVTVGKHLVRATAANTGHEFQEYVSKARLQAIETDYWLRLSYIVQQREDIQHDLSSTINQYSSIIELLQKMSREVDEHAPHTSQYVRGPKVSL